MKLRADAVCDMGCIRKNNEDILLLQNYIIRDDAKQIEASIGDEYFIAAVADGMGGHNAGEVASEMTVNSLRKLMNMFHPVLTPEQIITILELWIKEIHSEVTEASEKNAEFSGMGSTLAGLLIHNRQVFIFHAGDSRVYRLRDGILRQMTVDHSLRELTGDLTQPSNIICNSVGGGGDEVYLTVDNISVFEDDEFVICSDGLNDMISDKEIEELLSSNPDSQSLVDAAKAAGGKDNVSVIRIKFMHDDKWNNPDHYCEIFG